MNIQEDISLKDYSTMRLGGKAKYLVQVSSVEEMREAIHWAREQKLPFVVIGGGSNIIWTDDGYPGLVIVSRIMGVDIEEIDPNQALFTFGAGEDWDEMVEKTVNLGYSGIEYLSWIPGRVGATPVQNVGAYGREVAEVMKSLKAIDTNTDEIVTLGRKDCDFAYRSSRFNRADKGRFVILSVTFKLTRTPPSPPFYKSLQDHFDAQQITQFSPQILRDAVIAVRSKRLPDPDVVANNGSFFANPVVPQAKLDTIAKDHPTIMSWPMPDNQVKLSAAWLIEQAGFKDYHDKSTGMATWNRQPLVLINENAHSSKDLFTFRDKIIKAVKDKFGVTLEQEPEVIA